MNKNKNPKLALRKTTIRNLDLDTLRGAAGAMPRLTFTMDCRTANCMTLGQYCSPTNNCMTLGPFCIG